MELWIPLTIAGAFLQNLRSAFQKHLKSKLSDAGATYVRFFYAWPFALVYLWALHAGWNHPFPALNATFLIYCVLGGISQIAFTFLLVYLFSFRNFAVGTVYSKTEVLQVAILGFVLLGDTITLTGAVAVVVGVAGVMAISVAQTRITLASLFTSLTDRATVIGVTSGAFLGASVVFYRGAALSLDSGDVVMRAAYAMTISVVLQSLFMGIYLRMREPGQLTAVLRNWPAALPVGIAGVLGSICWFTAFTLENATYVRAVGQIELVFTFISSVFFFKEKTTGVELLGIALITAAILLLILRG